LVLYCIVYTILLVKNLECLSDEKNLQMMMMIKSEEYIFNKSCSDQSNLISLLHTPRPNKRTVSFHTLLVHFIHSNERETPFIAMANT
jgi:hypothetical protein